MYSIRRDIPTGRGFKYRVKVKAFKSSEAMHTFLNKQHDNAWSIMKTPLKSGVYIERGIPSEFINVKDIDPCALAHM